MRSEATDLQQLQRRLAATERRVRILGATTVLLGASALIAALRPPAAVLRARGLVITDAAGRERIVLGAPLREASADPKLAGAVGIAVLDGAGRLNTALGASTPLVLRGGRMGTRIAGSAGLTIYDPRDGSERGGIGAFADGRANMCLDYGTKVKEAACVSVAPGDQYAAFILNATPNEPQYDVATMFVSANGESSIKAFGGAANGTGVMIRGGGGPASVAVYDSAQRQITDLARTPGSR